MSAYDEVTREILVISSVPPPVRRRPRRSRRHFSGPTEALPPVSPLPLASLPMEPGGMVEVALQELGARLVAVLPDDTPAP